MLVARRPPAISLVSSSYRARLLRPWRLVTFVLSAAVFTLGAPYMGDPTWDRPVGALMSGFTYLLAPWSVGTLYRTLRRRASAQSAIVAVAGWLLATSSCYETYLLLRDGRLPPTTFSNLVASTTAFFAAGLFWSLTFREGRGVVFAFMLDQWPKGEEERRIAPSMVLVALFLATGERRGHLRGRSGRGRPLPSSSSRALSGRRRSQIAAHRRTVARSRSGALSRRT